MPESQIVPADSTFTAQIVADLGIEMDPHGLAGYEFRLGYDGDYLEVVSIADAGQLSGPNSRAVGLLGHRIDDASGRVLFGAYSCQRKQILNLPTR